MSEANSVFDILRGFRAAAYRLQLLLAGLGLMALVVAIAAILVGAAEDWTPAVGGGLLAASALWALAWRRHAERAFWRGVRVPRRGAAVRLPFADGGPEHQ
jgi:hypothetical protein